MLRLSLALALAALATYAGLRLGAFDGAAAALIGPSLILALYGAAALAGLFPYRAPTIATRPAYRRKG
jgi:hypothetical protein